MNETTTPTGEYVAALCHGNGPDQYIEQSFPTAADALLWARDQVAVKCQGHQSVFDESFTFDNGESRQWGMDYHWLSITPHIRPEGSQS